MKEINRGEVDFVPPSFKFIYVYHDGVQRAHNAWMMAQDCDVVLMENAAFSMVEREAWEKSIRFATFSANTKQGERWRKFFLSKRARSWGMAIIASSIESGKEFHFVDMEKDSLAYRLLDSGVVHYKNSLSLIKTGNPDIAFTEMKKSIEQYGQSNRIRSQIILAQVESLLSQKGADWSGKRVGVIEGLGHQATFGIFKERHADRDIEMVRTPAEGDLIFISLVTIAEKSPDKKINTTELKRLLLAKGIIIPFIQTLSSSDYSGDMVTFAERVALFFSVQEIEHFWNTIITHRYFEDVANEMIEIFKSFKKDPTGSRTFQCLDIENRP